MRVCVICPRPPNQLLGLLGVECQSVVGTPPYQVLKLFRVGCLVVTTDKAYHRGVICKLDYSVRAMYRYAVVGEEGVQDWA